MVFEGHWRSGICSGLKVRYFLDGSLSLKEKPSAKSTECRCRPLTYMGMMTRNESPVAERLLKGKYIFLRLRVLQVRG